MDLCSLQVKELIVGLLKTVSCFFPKQFLSGTLVNTSTYIYIQSCMRCLSVRLSDRNS